MTAASGIDAAAWLIVSSIRVEVNVADWAQCSVTLCVCVKYVYEIGAGWIQSNRQVWAAFKRGTGGIHTCDSSNMRGHAHVATDVRSEAVANAPHTRKSRTAVNDEVVSNFSRVCSGCANVGRRLKVVWDVSAALPSDNDDVYVLPVEKSVFHVRQPVVVSISLIAMDEERSPRQRLEYQWNIRFRVNRFSDESVGSRKERVGWIDGSGTFRKRQTVKWTIVGETSDI
jgi:hypothetical protein